MTTYISSKSMFVGEKDGYAEFVVSLSAASQEAVSVHYGTGSLSADSGAAQDYIGASGTLVFAPGTTSQTVRIAINDDKLAERPETFELYLSSPTNGVIANPKSLATIVDNDSVADSGHRAALSVRDVVVDAGARTASFAVVLDKAVGQGFSVAYRTVDGNASAGSDYVGASGTLAFGPGETVKTVTVALAQDGDAEPAEMFQLALGAVSGAGAGLVGVADGIGQATIGAHGQTPRSMPAISVSNPFAGEKDGYVEFVVSLDAPSESQVSVYYGTNSLSADNGYSDDFIGTNGTLVFAPGTTTQTVRVTLNDDLEVERLQNFELNLSSPVNAVIANRSGMATIVDNDTLADAAHHAGLSVRDVVVDASADSATFSVVLDKATGASFGVAYRTADGSAVGGSDYVAVSGLLTFGAGETVKTVTVALPHDVAANPAAEPAEMFDLVLGAVSGNAAGVVDVARGTGHATIGAHGQTASAAPLIRVGDIVVGEQDGYAEFVVGLDAPSASQVSVYYSTTPGTATNSYAGDFSGTNGTLVFAPGVTTQVVRVAIGGDKLAEQPETFSLHLNSATNATIARPTAMATIVDAATWQTVSGGAGLDTVTYGGARDDYTVTKAAGGFTVAATDGAGGTDQLAGIERIHFTDTNLALDIEGTGGQAYRIYQAAFNRAPDAVGLGFWMNAMDKGVSLTEVAAGFMQSREFIDTYGANPGNADFVAKVYMNVLHRPAEQGGLDYWVGALDQHLVTQAQALGMISESAENQEALAAVIGNGFAYTPYG